MDAKMIINLGDANFELPTRETNPEAWKILLGHVSARATYDELFDGEGTLTPAQVLEELICDNRDLPTTGEAWEILLEHVKENAMHKDLYLGDLDDDDIIQEARERGISYQDIYGEDATVGELFDDDDIIDYIREAEIPVDAVYDEDDILDCECVRVKIAELEEEVLTEEQKEAWAGQAYKDGWKEGWAGVDIFHGRYGDDEDRIEELERQLAQLKAKKCKVEETVDDDTILKGVECRKCGNTLPPHTVKRHLTEGDPILTCPHKTEE